MFVRLHTFFHVVLVAKMLDTFYTLFLQYQGFLYLSSTIFQITTFLYLLIESTYFSNLPICIICIAQSEVIDDSIMLQNEIIPDHMVVSSTVIEITLQSQRDQFSVSICLFMCATTHTMPTSYPWYIEENPTYRAQRIP